MIDLPFHFQNERTEFVDSFYAVVGRALTFATRYESNCRALAVIMGIKTALEKGSFSLDNDEDLELFVKQITRRTLNENIKNIISGLGLPGDVSGVMHNARKARNEVAHSLTLQMEDVIGDDKQGESVLQQTKDLVSDIAEADRLVCTLLHLETNEHLPSLTYIQNYREMIVNWVCEV